jgi:hypothetical protein
VENDEEGSTYDSKDKKAWKIKEKNSLRNIWKNVKKLGI